MFFFYLKIASYSNIYRICEQKILCNSFLQPIQKRTEIYSCYLYIFSFFTNQRWNKKMYVDSSSPRFNKPWFLPDAFFVVWYKRTVRSVHVVHIHTHTHTRWSVLVCTHTKSYYTHQSLEDLQVQSVSEIRISWGGGWTRRAGRWLVVTPPVHQFLFF